jgi:hypothetical protein
MTLCYHTFLYVSYIFYIDTKLSDIIVYLFMIYIYILCIASIASHYDLETAFRL